MAHQVLARKWRPRNFREMVGQEHVLKALVNALDQQRLHHAYLFTGTRGVGKTTLARILAKCLNCEAGTGSEPCGTCASCVEIAEGRSVDLLEVDAASRTKVEDTRELLDNVQYAPTRSRYKVYLIDEVHMLSTHSFNALLKTLEEPPEHVKFLLATTDPQKLPATVLSRCLQFNLKNMPPQQVVEHLQHVLTEEGIEYDEPALWLLGRAAAGSMRDALSLTDQAIGFGSGTLREADVRSMLGSVDLSFVFDLLEGVVGGDAEAVLATVDRIAGHALDFENCLEELITALHRVAIVQAVPAAAENGWGDSARIQALAAALSAEDAQLFYQVAINGRRDIGLATDPRSGLEMVLLRMLAFRPATRVETGGSSPAPGPGPDSSPAAAVAPEGGAAAKKPVDVPRADAPGAAVPAQPEAPAIDSALGGAAPAVDVEPLDWPALLNRLGLKGSLENIASNCELQSASAGELTFVLDRKNAGLFNPRHSDSLRAALEQHFGVPLSVTIMEGEVGQTPAMLRLQRIRERQAAAEAELEDDPRLRRLIERFDGELDRSSIVPLDNRE